MGNQWEQGSPGIQRHLRSHRPRSHGPVPARQLFDLIYREETLFNVIKSVTRNGRSILLTALLALILVYLFSIVGFLFLKDDFILEVDRLPGNHSGGLTAPLLGGGGGLGGWGPRMTYVRPRPWECFSTRLCASVSPLGFQGGLAHTILPPSCLAQTEGVGEPRASAPLGASYRPRRSCSTRYLLGLLMCQAQGCRPPFLPFVHSPVGARAQRPFPCRLAELRAHRMEGFVEGMMLGTQPGEW